MDEETLNEHYPEFYQKASAIGCLLTDNEGHIIDIDHEQEKYCGNMSNLYFSKWFIQAEYRNRLKVVKNNVARALKTNPHNLFRGSAWEYMKKYLLKDIRINYIQWLKN